MTDAQIKHMADRFLAWKLPEHFNPDCGISFDRRYRSEYGPVGTNLFDSTQVDTMVRHMIVGLPKSPPSPQSDEIETLRARVKELEMESDIVQHLQAALMFWMPGVYAADTADNERAAKDAYLLAGFDCKVPDRCWGDEMLARVRELEAELSDQRTIAKYNREQAEKAGRAALEDEK